ncbi:hypothetical protein LTR65_002581 [Meristemomyces frigidus]
MAAIPNNSRALAQATAVQPQHDEQWTCVVCGDTNSFGAGGQGRRPFAIDGPLYCVDCITEQFQLATDDESSWPPGIGSNTINIDDFVGVLPVDFVERYRAQEQIYNAGGALMRVHCPYDRAATETEPAERCNAFMGRLIRRPLVTSIVAHLQAILAILKPRQLNDAGRLSLPDSVFVQSFRNALVDSLRSVDATPQAAQAFCDLDNDHAMAYELAHQLPTLAMDAADESDRGGEAGHWAENHAWLQDMLLSVGQERQQIAEADEDGQPRLEQLYHLLSELEPLFRHMATPPTMYLDIPAQAWNTALRIRDATGYKPGRGPVRAVFADAYAFLREILAMYDRKTPGDLDRTPASLLPQTERANFHRRYGVVCDNLIAKQERKIQSLAVRGQADRHTDVAIRLLSALQHLLRRLNEPGQHPRQGNQEMLDHVRESWIRLDYGWGDFENRTEWARGDDSVFTIVRAVLLAADRVMEINAQAETARALLVAHLRAAENALQSSTDGEYVGGISAAWDRDTAIWQSVDCNIHPDHADTFDALLDHIGQVLHLGGLPAVIRTGDSDREYTDELWLAERSRYTLREAGGHGNDVVVIEWVPRLGRILDSQIASQIAEGETNALQWRARMERRSGTLVNGNEYVDLTAED